MLWIRIEVFDVNPDQTFHFDADSDPDPTLRLTHLPFLDSILNFSGKSIV